MNKASSSYQYVIEGEVSIHFVSAILNDLQADVQVGVEMSPYRPGMACIKAYAYNHDDKNVKGLLKKAVAVLKAWGVKINQVGLNVYSAHRPFGGDTTARYTKKIAVR